MTTTKFYLCDAKHLFALIDLCLKFSCNSLIVQSVQKLANKRQQQQTKVNLVGFFSVNLVLNELELHESSWSTHFDL